VALDGQFFAGAARYSLPTSSIKNPFLSGMGWA
jgi:hypothetical protein